MTYRALSRYIDIIYVVLFLLLLFGTPLLFTSLTRSVFEVNKLLLLRFFTLFMLVFALVRAVILNTLSDDEKSDIDEAKTYRFFGFRWKKVGLEIPAVLWVLFNILSTVFSENVRVSIIGAYDRWEGIITVVNYIILFYLFAKCLNRKWQLPWVLFGLILPACLSAVYGIYQSVGWDFMAWSVSPTARVFACINNPVHFCAYVAMIVPIGVGWLLTLSEKKETSSGWSLPVPKADLVVNYGALFVSLATIWLSHPGLYWFQKLIVSAISLAAFLIHQRTTALIPNKQFFMEWGGFAAVLLGLKFMGLLVLSGPWWVTIILFWCTYYVLAPAPNWQDVLKRFVYIGTIIVFYVQFLSYSRATWIGFIGSMSLFYLLSTGLLNQESNKSFVRDFVITALLIGLSYLHYVFEMGVLERVQAFVFVSVALLFLYQFFASIRKVFPSVRLPKMAVAASVLLMAVATLKLVVSAPVVGILLVLAVLFLLLSLVQLAASNWSRIQGLGYSTPNLAKFIVAPLLFVLAFGINFNVYLSLLPAYVVYPGLWLLLIFTVSYFKNLPDSLKGFLGRMVIIFLLIYLQFIVYSFYYAIIFGFLCWHLYALVLKDNGYLGRESKIWLLGVMLSFGLVLCFAATPTYVSQIAQSLPFKTMSQKELNSLKAANTMKYKMSLYAKDAQKGTARTSMWKSSMPWIKDYFLLGSGLDTIKYMYPQYRRPDYGILEGGHNFTPDRLHNEYLNTMATRGVIASIIFYGGFILGWIWLMLKGFYSRSQHPIRFLVASSLAGGLVYLGQIMFNFGVVATLVLFYVIAGIGLALVSHKDFTYEQD